MTHPAEHVKPQKRPRPDCTAERCMCKWLLFQMSRTNSKLKKGSVTA